MLHVRRTCGRSAWVGLPIKLRIRTGSCPHSGPNNSGWGGDYWTNSGNVVTNAHWYNYLVAGGYVTYNVLNCPGLTYVSKPYAVEASLTAVQSSAITNYSFGGSTFTLPAGMAMGDGWGRYICNYAYPRDTFGTSEKDSSPSFFSQYPRGGRKR